MMRSKTEVLLFLFLVFVKQKYAQPTAVISPRGYNASLDHEASFTFQCNTTGADDVQWFIDGLPSTRREIRNRGISASDVDGATGSLRRSLTIVRSITNRMTTILCTANTFSSPGIINSSVSSVQVLFKIQGLLDVPSNLMLSEADNRQHIRRLSWNEPFSLDITDVDPDISYYEVCYNLVDANKSQCVRVNQSEFSFPYVNVPLLFTVSAVNVVGEGNASSVLHDGNGCTNTTGDNLLDLPIINASEVQTRVLSGYNPVARFLFKQLLGDINGITCFPVYKIESSPLSAENTTDHGIQIPGVLQYSPSSLSIQLSLTVDSDLVVNEQYSATITAINADGQRGNNVTVKFDTYDVQSVSGRAIAGGLELSCRFAEGSQAQSCILTIYRILDNSTEIFIADITISREDQTQTSDGQILSLKLGQYVVREVAEVESDGQVTIHRRRDILKLVINDSTLTTTLASTIPDTPSTGRVSVNSVQNIGPIIGGVLGGICLIITVVIVIIVIFILVWSKKKREENQNLLFESGSSTGHRNSESEMADPMYAAIASSSQKLTRATESTDSTSPPNQKLQNDSPTFPLYTEVMGKGKPKAEEGDGSQPEVPQKQLTKEDLKELNLPTDEDVPTVPQQNLTTEDIQQMALSTDETGEEINSTPTTSNTPASHDELLLSSGPQSSQTPVKATAAASRGDTLYAELEHKKGKQIITPPDMTEVQYSEIKTDEIPPRLPQKKSRKSRDQSSSSPMTSAPGSTTSLDTYKV